MSTVCAPSPDQSPTDTCRPLFLLAPRGRASEILREQEEPLAAAGLPASDRASGVQSLRWTHAQRLAFMEVTGVVGTSAVGGWHSMNRCDDLMVMRHVWTLAGVREVFDDGDIDCDTDSDTDVD